MSVPPTKKLSVPPTNSQEDEAENDLFDDVIIPPEGVSDEKTKSQSGKKKLKDLPSDEDRITAAKAAEEAKKQEEARKIAEIKRASDAKVFIERDYQEVKSKLSETVVNMIEKHYEGDRNDYVAYEAWIMKVIVRESFGEMDKKDIEQQPVLNREVIEAVKAGEEYDIHRAYRVWHEMLTVKKEAEELKSREEANRMMKSLTDAQKLKMTAVQIAQHDAENAELRAQEYWKAQRRKLKGE